jgi:hypothetical protein
VVEHLSNKQQALSSNPTIAKKISQISNETRIGPWMDCNWYKRSSFSQGIPQLESKHNTERISQSDCLTFFQFVFAVARRPYLKIFLYPSY